MIKNHPVVGAKVAEENESTRKYVDIIRGHHLWYDCSRGYPYGTDTFKSPYKTIIDLVLAADCLDAATDTVGRSYNKGKNFEDYIKEVTEGAGTHYAPFLPDFLKSPGVKQDVMYLLTERRAKLYKDTFNLLRNNELENIKARFH
jgi:HD-GYP domain-containing protein (c-di-GMP phosphodiesterase class II)